jgi:hypothetical protein
MYIQMIVLYGILIMPMPTNKGSSCDYLLVKSTLTAGLLVGAVVILYWQ